jgi:AcrR family transcriptional regulator
MMARIVNQEEYDLRRSSILESAQRLVYTKGYEGLSIQDILADQQISKGAFYHYFPSKQALLETLIEHLAAQVLELLNPIVQDEHLPATEKLQRFFSVAARWKTARKEYLLTLMRTWYADENAILRLKTQAALMPLVSPLFISIVRQGVNEGVFRTQFQDQACDIIFSMLQSFGDILVRRIAKPGFTRQDLHYLELIAAAYQDATERILGADPGSLPLIDPAILREWMPLSGNSN